MEVEIENTDPEQTVASYEHNEVAEKAKFLKLHRDRRRRSSAARSLPSAMRRNIQAMDCTCQALQHRSQREATGGTMQTVAQRLWLTLGSLKSHLQRAKRVQKETLFDLYG